MKEYFYYYYFNKNAEYEHKIKMEKVLNELENDIFYYKNDNDDNDIFSEYYVIENIEEINKIPENTTHLGFDFHLNEIKIEDINSRLDKKIKKKLKHFNFGHDGILYSDNKKEEIEKLLKDMPKLTKIFYCGYYCQFANELIKQVKKKYYGKCIAIGII